MCALAVRRRTDRDTAAALRVRRGERWSGITGLIEPLYGAPCWVNLATRDLPAAREFYTAVLGWTFRSASHEDNYLIAFLDDTPVAGLADASAAIGGPLAWTPYFAVPDLGSAAGNAQDRGGMVAVGPLGVAHGRAAIAADPQGARFGMWQGRAPASWHPCHGEPPARLDLHTRDAFAAAMYYGELFGWQNDEDSECCSVEYEQETVVVRSRRHVVGTLYSGSAEQPPDPRVTTWWEVTFYVDDPEAARSAAGGSGVHTPDRLHPDAADVRLTDPSGVPFSVRKLR